MIGRTNAVYSISGISAIGSYINVVYPQGSTCVCTNGILTIKSQNTSGAASFGIPSIGYWTVSCTNGEDNKEKTILVYENNVYNVKLEYELVLVKNGILQSPDDWTYFGTGYFTGIEPTHSQQDGYYSMHIQVGSQSLSGAAVYNYPLNINMRSRLEVTGDVWGSDATDSRVSFVLSTSKTGNPDWSISNNTHIAHHSVNYSSTVSEITKTIWDLSGGGYPEELYLMVYINVYGGWTSSGIQLKSLKLV